MKIIKYYTCKTCGRKEPKWLGRCPDCGSWNSFAETESDKLKSIERKDMIPIPISAIELKDSYRYDSGIEELNRVLGGGIMKGSTVLVGGEPGIGKSTLMLQLAGNINLKGRILYISGEESAGQLKMRAERLEIEQLNIEIFCETELSAILKVLDNVKPVLIIVDSVQTIYKDELKAIPGSPTQVKMCTFELNEYSKQRSASLFLIGHVTKEGLIAGPKVVEHIVDSVLYFDQSDSDIRILRSTKNRFGPTHEIGLFTMSEKGLIQIKDPASRFLEHRNETPPPGVAVVPVYEGTRVLLVEIQSLVIPAKGNIPRVFSDKIDSRRISRIAAVLEKHLKISFTDLDIYVNVAGGLKITEVGIDLPLCLSLYSAKTDLPLPERTAVMGEVSLAGQIRSISYTKMRINAAFDMGFNFLVGPHVKEEKEKINECYTAVSTVQEAVRAVFVNEKNFKKLKS